MKFALAVAVLAGAALAHENHNHLRRHHNNLLARQASSTCACSTVYSTIYGQATLIAPTAGSSTAASSSSAPTSTDASSSVAASTTAASSSTQAASAAVFAASASPVSRISAGGANWAMAYSPYNNDHSCKTAAQVDADLQTIAGKGFASIRLYATDCDGLINAGVSARKYGLKIIVGIFITGSGIGGAGGQLNDIKNWAQWDLVDMVVAGNEAIFNGYVTAGDLAGFIGTVKSTLSAAGYTGVVTTAETVDVIQKNAAVLCAAVDVVGPNIHPFFDPGTVATASGPFFTAQVGLVAAACPGKAIYVLETGWPSQGNANGQAVPGTAQQLAAVSAIKSVAGGKAVYLSFVNDMWKDPGSLGVEQFFGCSGLF